MAFSTLLTLYVVPCFYSVMARFEKRQKHAEIMAEAAKEEARLTRKKT